MLVVLQVCGREILHSCKSRVAQESSKNLAWAAAQLGILLNTVLKALLPVPQLCKMSLCCLLPCAVVLIVSQVMSTVTLVKLWC